MAPTARRLKWAPAWCSPYLRPFPPAPQGSMAQGTRSDLPAAGWPPQHLQLGPSSSILSPAYAAGPDSLRRHTWSFLGPHSPSSGQRAAFNLPALNGHTEGLLVGSAAFTAAREDSRPQIWASSLPDTSPGTPLPNGQRLVLPSAPQSKSFQEQDPRPAPPLGASAGRRYLRELLCRSDHQQNSGSLFFGLSPSILFPQKAWHWISPRWSGGAGDFLVALLSGALAPSPGEKARQELPQHLQHHDLLQWLAATALLGR